MATFWAILKTVTTLSVKLFSANFLDNFGKIEQLFNATSGHTALEGFELTTLHSVMAFGRQRMSIGKRAERKYCVHFDSQYKLLNC